MVYRQQPGQADSPDREPERVQPVPEQYEGVNFPYRGTQKHGVEVPKDAQYDTREFEWDESAETPDEYMEPEPEPDPIPVRVVNESARERLDWRPVRHVVTDQGQRILNRHDRRGPVRIQNMSLGSNVYVGNDAGVQPYTGFRIKADSEIYPFTSTEDVWAIADSGETADICIMYEFSVEL